MTKDLYSRKMLEHDYTDEAANYVDANMSDDEIIADVRQIFADNYIVEDDDIVEDYIEYLLSAVAKMRGDDDSDD